jgi:hypothetical protein
MTLRPVLYYALGVLGMSLSLRAERVQVISVAGEVLYGPGDRTPSTPVKTGESLEAGTFSAAANGILCLSTFSGSELRLAEAGTLHFYGTEEFCHLERQAGNRSTFRLLQGKLRVTIGQPATPPHFYRVMVQRGSNASVESGQCVMCLHGDGTYVFVARGRTILSGANETAGSSIVPRTEGAAITRIEGAAEKPPIILTGNGKVGFLGWDGGIVIEPLSMIGAAAQTCLLTGLDLDAADGRKRIPVDASRRPFSVDSGAGPPPRPHFNRRFIVSPTQ